MPALNNQFQQEINKLYNSEGLVELFTLDATMIQGLAQVYRFTNNLGPTGGGTTFGGVTYQAIPIQAEGFDSTSNGTLPRPVLTISNVSKTMLAAVLGFGDLVGAHLYRTVTYTHFLDGASKANPNAKHGPEKWYIDQMIHRDATSIQWALSTDLDKMGFKFGRQVLKDKSVKHLYAPGVARSRVPGS